jgi:hypothetical protein
MKRKWNICELTEASIGLTFWPTLPPDATTPAIGKNRRGCDTGAVC